MFQSMVATSQGVSIKQQINWAEVLVGWDQPEKCFWLNLTNLKFEAMEVTVSCRICILLHILIYIYIFIYIYIYIYISYVTNFRRCREDVQIRCFSNNFTLSFLDFKYCPQDIGCCFESGNVTSEISSWVEHEAFFGTKLSTGSIFNR